MDDSKPTSEALTPSVSTSKTYDDGLKFGMELLTVEMINALKGFLQNPGVELADPSGQLVARVVMALGAERMRAAKESSAENQ
jgi:hypothetical protein